MCLALNVQEENHSDLIDRKLIKQALQKEIFHVARIDSGSTNGRFCSIKFTTTQIMSTFCTEPLEISENNIVFKPDD